MIAGNNRTQTTPINSHGQPRSTSPSSPHTLTAEESQALWDEICYGNGTCTDRGPNTLNSWLGPQIPTTPGDAGPGGTVTIADVARFLPGAAALHAEPDGWAVVGVPANFWVAVTPVTVDGELLGDRAQVRFTPRAYRWDYGDGSHRATTDPGASWASLGQEELTATPTSHVYEERASLRASVSVVYSAEYRVGGDDWTAVVGAVSGTAPPIRMLVVRERTALTARSG